MIWIQYGYNLNHMEEAKPRFKSSLYMRAPLPDSTPGETLLAINRSLIKSSRRVCRTQVQDSSAISISKNLPFRKDIANIPNMGGFAKKGKAFQQPVPGKSFFSKSEDDTLMVELSKKWEDSNWEETKVCGEQKKRRKPQGISKLANIDNCGGNKHNKIYIDDREDEEFLLAKTPLDMDVEENVRCVASWKKSKNMSEEVEEFMKENFDLLQVPEVDMKSVGEELENAVRKSVSRYTKASSSYEERDNVQESPRLRKDKMEELLFEINDTPPYLPEEFALNSVYFQIPVKTINNTHKVPNTCFTPEKRSRKEPSIEKPAPKVVPISANSELQELTNYFGICQIHNLNTALFLNKPQSKVIRGGGGR